MFVSSSARVYSCGEQFDAALISNYDSLQMEEAVNCTCPVVTNKVSPLGTAKPIIIFFSTAKDYHLSNKSQQERLAF